MKKILTYAVAAVAVTAFLSVQSCTDDPAAPDNTSGGADEPSATVSVSDIDLWANTAKVTVTAENVSDLKVYYGEKGSQASHEIEPDENGNYFISAGYTTSDNDAGLKVSTPVEGTGVFAGRTYVVEVFDGEPSEENAAIATEEFTAESGDVIPNADMSGWSTTQIPNLVGQMVDVPYPNAEGSSFWSSGNNGITAGLCTNDNNSAKLEAAKVIIAFACGNMYVGTFSYGNLVGTASFGQKFEWTARPKALKVKMKAEIGAITDIGTLDPLAPEADDDPSNDLIKGESIDMARIYAVVTDWTAPHGVKSGIVSSVEDINPWDPATQTSVDGSGAILGYASQMIDESTEGDDFVTIEIPFVWYDTETRPAADNYSIVISCATSYRGDYLTGCATNKLWVDDFEFVY